MINLPRYMEIPKVCMFMYVDVQAMHVNAHTIKHVTNEEIASCHVYKYLVSLCLELKIAN